MALRVGIVDFLNSWPLAWSFLLDQNPPGLEAVYLPPNRVAEELASGELDVGLIPSIELQRIDGLRLIPGLCVAATREVRSVLLLLQSPVESVSRVALDESSRTSTALVKILMERVWGNSPEYVSAPADPERMLENADAALVIGDPALKVRRDRTRVLDLAGEWRRWTGLPFVFAVWATRVDSIEPGSKEASKLCEALESSLEMGTKQIDRVIARAVKELHLGSGEVREYLTRNLSYRLGDEERAGLELYYQLASECGLIDSPRSVEYL